MNDIQNIKVISLNDFNFITPDFDIIRDEFY